MPKKSQREKLEHHQIFRSFFGWRQPCTLHAILSMRIVQLRIQGTVGMVLTVSQMFGKHTIVPHTSEKAIRFMNELLTGEELAMFIPESIMPQVVSEQPISPIPAHICLAGSEETVVMKLKQRGYLRPE